MSRLLLALAIAACVRAPLKLRSSFGDGGEFPTDNRGDEDNVSPVLRWTGAPKKTESFVLIVDSAATAEGAGSDSSEGQQTHWLVYDIPKEVNETREELSGDGASDVARLGMKEDAGQAPVVVDPMSAMDGYVDPEIKAMQDMIYGAVDSSFEDKNRAKEGKTSFGGTTYVGPQESGSSATFKLYALSSRLDHLPRGASREQVMEAMKGKVLDKAVLTAKI